MSDQLLDETFLKKTLEKFINDNFGERCPEYCSGCIVCECWRGFDFIFGDIIDCNNKYLFCRMLNDIIGNSNQAPNKEETNHG
jgi:hypothetical protein